MRHTFYEFLWWIYEWTVEYIPLSHFWISATRGKNKYFYLVSLLEIDFFCPKVTDWQMRSHIWSTQFPGGIQDRSIYFRHGRQHLSHSSFLTERNSQFISILTQHFIRQYVKQPRHSNRRFQSIGTMCQTEVGCPRLQCCLGWCCCTCQRCSQCPIFWERRTGPMPAFPGSSRGSRSCSGGGSTECWSSRSNRSCTVCIESGCCQRGRRDLAPRCQCWKGLQNFCCYVWSTVTTATLMCIT